MAEKIKNLKNKINQAVEIKGWVFNLRSSGKIAFFTGNR